MEDHVIFHSFHTEKWKTDLFIPKWVLDFNAQIAIRLELNITDKCFEVTYFDAEDYGHDDYRSHYDLKKVDKSIFKLIKSQTRCPQFSGSIEHPKNQYWNSN